MKDTPRPPPSTGRSAPYNMRKPKTSSNGSPLRGTRRPYDASHPPHEMTSLSDRIHGSRRDEQHSRAVLDPSTDNDRRRIEGHRVPSHFRPHPSSDESARERPPHISSTLGVYADLPGSSLRLPLTYTSSAANTLIGQRKAESPLPGSVTAFLRSIELPDKPSSAPQARENRHTPPPPRPPPLSTDATIKTACTNGGGYQVSLVYKGYSFDYDLSALPDDPKGTIALLNLTKSGPGAYILVGAHYRRTGRSSAACAVIRSLLDNLDSLSDVQKGNDDAVPVPVSATSTVTLVAPGSPKQIEYSGSTFRNAAVRPAMLLLAACELDISRERPDDPDSASHATVAHDLFRAVYGTVNDAIVAGAVRSQPKNALGLDFSGDKNFLSSSLSDTVSQLPSGALEAERRIKDLEKELSATWSAQRKLQERLAVSSGRLARAEDKVHALESRSREMIIQLDASRDENWELRRRLTEFERRERELVQHSPSAENRVWGRLKDLFFDNLGGGVRGV